MTLQASNRGTAGRRPARLRATLVGLLAALGWILAGCSDPDDGDGDGGGGGGGGYVAQEPIGYADH